MRNALGEPKGWLNGLYELVLKNARVRFDEGLVNIGVRDGKIVEISHDRLRCESEIDVRGKLVTAPFVNPHLHLCKVYTFEKIGDDALRLYQQEKMLDASEAIRIAAKVKKWYSDDVIFENGKRALAEAVKHGCLYVRAFVDTDTLAGLTAVKAVLRLKKTFAGLVHLQVVAFPQEGVLKDPGAEELVWKAMELGCDVVGGIPWIERSAEDSRLHVDKMFEIAKAFDKDVAMLTDDAGNSNLRTTGYLARKTIAENMVGRSSAHHARALSLYPKNVLTPLMQLLKKADVSVISNPHTGPLHAPVKQLLKHGINVALGQDDIADAYYPFGRNKMTEIAFLAAHLLRMMSLNEVEKVFDMVTAKAAKAMRLVSYGLETGGNADFVILDASSVYEAVWNQAEPILVIKDGKIIYRREERTELKFED